jgi:hypothetical protein
MFQVAIFMYGSDEWEGSMLLQAYFYLIIAIVSEVIGSRAKRDRRLYAARSLGRHASAPLPKFVIRSGRLRNELRKQRGTSKFMIVVPLFDLKFLSESAASAAGTSNRRH